jgi:general secretion pathway protein D
MNTNTSISRFLAVFLSLCLLLPSLALADGKNGKKNYKEGRKYEEQQQWDMAAQHYALALSAEPNNPEYKLHYLRALQQASLMYVKRGDALAEQNDYASAYTAYRQAYNYDQGNEIARYKMERMLDMQKAQAAGGDQFNYNPRTGNVKPVNNDIQLATKSRPRGEVSQTVTFKDTQFKAVVGTLGKQLGLNVVFDESIKDTQKVTVDLQDVTLAKALDIIMMQQKATFEQVDRRTIFVYADNGTNRPRFEKMMIKTFYLGNISANMARTVLTPMLPPGRQMAPVDSGPGAGGAQSNSNILIVKATPAELQMVQDILSNIDKNKNEVVLDIEIYEVSHDSLLQVGNQLVTKPLPVIETRYDKDGRPVTVTQSNSASLDNLGGIGRGGIAAIAGNQIAGNIFTPFLGGIGTLIGLPPTQFSLLQSRGNSKLLHKTQIHVLDGGQNQTKVGRSVPVRLGTSYGYGGGFGGLGGFGGGLGGTLGQTGTIGTGVQGGINAGLGNALGTLGGFGGGAGFPGIDSIQYRDVGLVIKAQPQITNEGYVEVKMEFETSDVVASGSDATNLTPIFTQRSLNTTARIQDGITAVVAGVNQETKGDSRASIPVLGMLPLVGRLFTTPRQESRQSDVIITVTPHIIRSAGITPKDYLAITGPPQQGFLNQSVEDVVNRAQAEEEQERRLIAQQNQTGVPLDNPVAAPNTQNANFGAPAPVTGGSQPAVQPVNNPDNRNPRVFNNSSVGPVTNVGNPVPSPPVIPEPQQPEIQINTNESNSGSDNPQQPGQAGQPGPGGQPGQAGQNGQPGQAGQNGQPGKEGEVDLSQYVTQPAQPVAPASVVTPQRPEHVERAIARMMAEERARRATEVANKPSKPQAQASVEFPKEYINQAPQQKVTQAVPLMNSTPRANSPVTFSLSPKPIKQQLGKTFTVTVEASSQAQMSGANIALKYDASKLQVKSVKDGGTFGAQPEFSYDISQKGTLIVRLRQPQNAMTVVNGRIFTIEFAAIGEGQSEIAFNSNDTRVRVGSAQIPAGGSATQVIISRDAVTSSNEK